MRARTWACLTTGIIAAVAGCGDNTLEDAVVRPGITAIEESKAVACGADADALRTALEIYETMEGAPAPDEAALVTAGRLREESELWDVSDGALVPAHPDCGPVPADTPSGTSVVEIVTDVEPTPTADEVFATFTADDIAGVGGEACARELAAIFSAGARYVAERGEEPVVMDDLVAGGFLGATPELWVVSGDDLVPVEGSGCVAFGLG